MRQTEYCRAIRQQHHQSQDAIARFALEKRSAELEGNDFRIGRAHKRFHAVVVEGGLDPVVDAAFFRMKTQCRAQAVTVHRDLGVALCGDPPAAHIG